MQPPKSSSFFRKSWNILKPIRCVRFTEAVLRHANIRDQNPSLGMICPGDPHQRNPNAPKFEDRSQEETEWQERCAREAAWNLAKNILNLKEHETATFFSLSENWCLLVPSTIKPEEREFVVDSGASMHMISRKDLNSAEFETLTASRSPTTVITAKGEVQTHEEATVYVKELDIFLTMKVLENTPAVLSLGKLCDENRYSYEWVNGQKPHLIENGIRVQCGTENFVPIVVLGLSTTPSSSYTSTLTITIQQSCQVKVWIDKYWETRILLKHQKSCCMNQPKSQNPKTPKNHEQVRGDPSYSDIPQWLQEFRDNLVDEWVPEHRDSHASSSHEPSLEPVRSVDLSKQSVDSHFPKDRNYEICQRNKITRAPCRRRIGGVIPRAENFGDLITADHKVLSEGCESRNNHRYAVVVQDLATPWIQSYPRKTSQETERSLQKFLEPK